MFPSAAILHFKPIQTLFSNVLIGEGMSGTVPRLLARYPAIEGVF